MLAVILISDFFSNNNPKKTKTKGKNHLLRTNTRKQEALTLLSLYPAAGMFLTPSRSRSSALSANREAHACKSHWYIHQISNKQLLCMQPCSTDLLLCMYTHTHTHKHPQCKHTHPHPHTQCTHTHTHTHACMQTHAHAGMHTRTHTHTHTHTKSNTKELVRSLEAWRDRLSEQAWKHWLLQHVMVSHTMSKISNTSDRFHIYNKDTTAKLDVRHILSHNNLRIRPIKDKDFVSRKLWINKKKTTHPGAPKLHPPHH